VYRKKRKRGQEAGSPRLQQVGEIGTKYKLQIDKKAKRREPKKAREQGL